MPKSKRDTGPGLATDDVIAFRYVLEREIARGGMGTVWVAKDKKLGRKIALKIMMSGTGDDSAERFEREAKAVAQLHSTHVVEVHDYGIDEGVPYIAMELLRGESLGDRLKRDGRLPVEEVAEILVQVAKGLKAAHGAGLVHRDLKPSNIYLAQRDDSEVVKLLDFGVVKAVDRHFSTESTASGIVLGTPQYMSPEQARGIKEIDSRADLWSLGVIVLRMLTGNNPFGSDSVGDAVIKICIEPIPKASEFQGIPEELDGFFERALARDPEARFQTGIDLARDFLHRVGLSSRELRGERHSRLDLVDAARLSAVDTGKHAAVDRSADANTGSVELTPPPLPAMREPSPSSSGSLRTPVSATVGGTEITRSVSVQVPVKSNRPLIYAGGGAMALLGGIVAFAMLGGGSKDTPDELGAPTTTTVATTASAEPSSTETPSASSSVPSATPAPSTAPATPVTDAGSVADGSAPPVAKTGKPQSGKPGTPGGQWLPSGHSQPGTKPRWY